MNYYSKNSKLIQLGIVLFGFFALILMTGQYSEIIDVRDGFTKAVERGEIVPVTGFSESISMIIRGQLPPQLVRIPELHFLNPVVSTSIAYILTTLLIMAGLIFNNYYAKIQSTKISLVDWCKKYWTKLLLYTSIAIFCGFFVAPSLFTWFFGDPTKSSFWNLPIILTEFANFLMYELLPVEIYDSEIEEFDEKERFLSAARKTVKGVQIHGIDNVMMNFGKCCNPIPGDNVFGFITTHGGITIHRTTCPNAKRLKEKYEYRVLEIKWLTSGGDSFSTANLRITGEDELGVVGSITKVITDDLRVNMRSINFQTMGSKFVGKVSVRIKNNDHLDQLIHKINKVKGVDKAIRIK